MMPFPDIDEFDERAASCEFDSDATRDEAEDYAAQLQGFADADDYWGWLAEYVLKRGVPR
jgi:hypothetical protein